ncbi:MAG: DUF494 family protein [Ignavibacteria bacterium]|nr:DUF494 family protein [Ignavibacteria bacterium]
MFQERVLEIIIFILNELKHEKNFSDIDYSELTKIGYTDSEINTAIAWIYSRIQENEKMFFENLSSTKSIRVLNSVEKRLFTPEAIGYLITIRELGIISEEDFEFLIDKITSLNLHKVDLADLKPVISSFVLNLDDPHDKRNRLLINNNDTIN